MGLTAHKFFLGGEINKKVIDELYEGALSAEITLEKIGKRMALEFQKNGTKWPREWMEKHSHDRAVLIEARKILIDMLERNVKEQDDV